MAIDHMDNFSQYGTGSGTGSTAILTMLNGLYAEVGALGNSDVALTTDPDGVSSGAVFAVGTRSGSDGGFLRRVLNATQTTVGMGFRLFLSSLPTGNTTNAPQVQFRDSTNTAQLSISVTTTGAIQAYRGTITGGTLLGATSGPVIVANAWNHIECKVLIDDAAGTVEVRVNGVAQLTLTGVDTKATSTAGCSQYVLGSIGSSFVAPFMYWKDLIVWNTSGSYNNDFIGDVKVVTLLPESDVSLNWTPSTGSTGWDLIDETTPNDADYISADATPPAAYVCELTDLDEDVTSVKGLMTVVRMLKTDGGDANVQVGLVSAGDVDNGADRPITTAATYWFDISEENPDTAAPWTPVNTNSAQLRINRTV